MRSCLLYAALCLGLLPRHNASAQNTRLGDRNTIGWFNYFGTVKLGGKFGLHTEYQWRRIDLTTRMQQGLLRTGVNYQANPKIQVRLGYAWIETAAYGEIPINALGRDFTEHRAFQMLTLADKTGILDFSHRFMLEQRWVGRYSAPAIAREDEFVFSNRLRYMFRVQVPLKGKTIGNRTPYAAVYDEIFIGFGRNVNENVFDQNRLGVLLGYRFNETLRLEVGYLSQILQLGREVNGRNVFQYNNGLIVNTLINLDFSRPAKQ